MISYSLDLRYFYRDGVEERPTKIGACLTTYECKSIVNFMVDGSPLCSSLRLNQEPLEITKKDKKLKLYGLNREDFLRIIRVIIEIMERWLNPTENREYATKLLHNFLAFSYFKQESSEKSVAEVLGRLSSITSAYVSFGCIVNIEEEVLSNEARTLPFKDLKALISSKTYNEDWIVFLNLFVDIYEHCCC